MDTMVSTITELLTAHDALRYGQAKQVKDALKSALASAKHLKTEQLHILSKQFMYEVCISAKHYSIETEFAEDLINTLDLHPQPAQKTDHGPARLFITTLENFSVTSADEQVRLPRTKSTKPIELLKLLVGRKNKDISTYEAQDILWPDQDGDQASSCLDVTLHRLRKHIGKSAVVLSNGRLSLDQDYCRVDVWEFEQLVNTIDTALKHGDLDQQTLKTYADLIISRYPGHFMKDESTLTYVIGMREYFKDKFRRTVIALGEQFEHMGNHENAELLYHEAMAVDNTVEEFFTRCIACLTALGHLTRALSVYQQCKHMCFDNYQLPPSADTETLYRRLISA